MVMWQNIALKSIGNQNQTIQVGGFLEIANFAWILLLGFPTGLDFFSHGTKGQKTFHCPRTKEQQDKLKILPQNGPGPNFDILLRTSWDKILTASPVPYRNILGQPWDRRKKRVGKKKIQFFFYFLPSRPLFEIKNEKMSYFMFLA